MRPADAIEKAMQDQDRKLQCRLDAIEDSVARLQDQVARVDGKRRQLHDSVDRRFDTAQDNFSKFALSQYEAQSELFSLKKSSEQLLSRERDAARSLQALQSSHDQVFRWVQALRQDCGQFQAELFAFKEQTSGICVAVASDVQAIAKECSAVRTALAQSSGQLHSKMETLRDALDRQTKLDRQQLSQRLDVLSENLATHELRSRDAFTTLLKNHSRIRAALDEGMGMCSRDLRTLSHEVKVRESEQQSKIDALAEQLTTNALEWIQKHEALESALRVV
ncbi:hypothetical protein PybrP1_010993 [[Pythium] brassicae (nom. inval.)]|nr:hypothetical protein PybrP1_010993 [[Pythium] brassicae (nom. inval.)]